MRKVVITEAGLSTVDIKEDKNRSIVDGAIRWNEVYTVSYYALDAVTEVNLCLVFDFDFGEYIEVYDYFEGWDILVRDLDKFLPIQDKNWREGLTKCKENDECKTIYERKV